MVAQLAVELVNGGVGLQKLEGEVIWVFLAFFGLIWNGMVMATYKDWWNVLEGIGLGRGGKSF